MIARRGTSEMLFVPVGYQSKDTNVVTAPSILRAEWLANGRDIVVAYSARGRKQQDHDGLGVALIPWGARKPIRVFHVPQIKDAGEVFMAPLCIAGDRLFLRTSGKEVARLDLENRRPRRSRIRGRQGRSLALSGSRWRGRLLLRGRDKPAADRPPLAG